jgi:hypothetical protein
MKPASSPAPWQPARIALQVAVGLMLTVGAARPALAQLSLPAGTQTAINTSALGVHAAYDPGNNVYLVVGANGHVTAAFVNTLGQPVTGPIEIKPPGPGGVYGAFPRPAYSPDLGGFLVVWAQEGGGTVRLFMRTVVYPGVLGAVQSVTDSTAWLAVAGPAIAYSPTSQRFLIAYKTLPPAFVRVQAVANDGTPIGSSVQISSGFGRDPGVAWNPARDEFGVSYSGEGSGGSFFSAFVRVPASNPAAFARTTFNETPSGMTAITDIDFNPITNRYVMVWWEPGKARAAEISDLGIPLTMGTASFVVGANSYDALGVARNPSSGTFLLVGLSGSDDDVGGRELNANGFPISDDTVLSASPANLPARYVRVSTRQGSPEWLASFNRQFSAIMAQAAATGTTNGGPAGSYPPVGGGPPPGDPPIITTQPASPTIAAGTSAQLSVVATGTGPLTYQWYEGNSPNTAQPIPGATAATFVTPALTTSKRYWVQVANAFGADNSNTAFVTATHVTNGGFWGNSMAGWSLFATPALNYIQWGIDNEVLQFYRVPPPSGTNQATVFQQTGASFAANTGIRAFFQLGNTSSVRKRISVLLTDADFSDLAVCTFWLAPNTPLQTYAMLSHTTEAWSNASIYFYAASTGANGGTYLLDNVVVEQDVTLPTNRTECFDPNAPAPALLPHSSNLVANPTFDSGTISPWIAFGTLSHQVSGGVIEMLQPPGPAGSFLQLTGTPMAANDILSASFSLGNSSGVRKRVTVLLHDSDFSDLSVCSFWLPAGAPLQTYAMTMFATKAWSNATLSFYVATQGFEPWVRLDNVFVQRAPTVAMVGTECLEPGAVPFQLMSAAGAAANSRGSTQSKAARAAVPAAGSAAAGRAATPIVAQPAADLLEAAHRTDWIETLDLRSSSTAVLSFESSLSMDGASSAEIQVSEDGTTWQTLVQVPASDDWITLNVDLGAWAGRVVQVRFAFDAKAPRRGGRPDTWLIGDVRVVR